MLELVAWGGVHLENASRTDSARAVVSLGDPETFEHVDANVDFP